MVVARASATGSVTIAGLRDALGTSRKHAQALLEHLDAAGSRAASATSTCCGPVQFLP